MLGPCQRKKSIKPHVRTACINCKKAHLACDAERPCKRCISVGKTDSCYDIQHKKRGRPKLREKFTSSLLTTTGSNSSNTVSSYSAIPKRPMPRHQQSSMPHFQPMLPLTLPTPPTSSIITQQQHHQLTTSPIDSLAPFLAVSPPSSSFVMTKPTTTQQGYDLAMTETMNDTMMTLFLTTEMCCARASDETMDFIGYHPQELAHRSLYDFISNPADLHQVHQHLTQSHQQSLYYTSTTTPNTTNGGSGSPSSSSSSPSPSSSVSSSHSPTSSNDYYHQMPPSTLLNIANGSKTFKMALHFNTPEGKDTIPLSARFYFGGGLGADLCQPSTLDHLYIVCLLTKPSTYAPSSLADTKAAVPSPISPPTMNASLLMTDMQNVMTDLSSLSCLSSSLSSTYSSTSSTSSTSLSSPSTTSHIVTPAHSSPAISIPPPTSCAPLMMTPPYSSNHQITSTLDHEESSLVSQMRF
ncbi:hypothetical protein [Absidia glauca]|uniref:Zn(2)-C6 fungal-type domain-containing protein n=1 Tax=Absidia glauca TaxID=4829 RepID=A0A163M9D5_ABSGL|nr:hypothetical protein [Absidia glauca]